MNLTQTMYKYERGDGVDENKNTTKQNEEDAYTHLAADMMRGAVVITSRKRGADNVSIALFSSERSKKC